MSTEKGPPTSLVKIMVGCFAKITLILCCSAVAGCSTKPGGAISPTADRPQQMHAISTGASLSANTGAVVSIQHGIEDGVGQKAISQDTRLGAESTIRMNAMVIQKARLSSYVLAYDIYRKILTMSGGNEAPPEAIASGKGIIWAEDGYWNCQIIAINGVLTSTLSRAEWHHAIFNSSDPVRLSMRTRSGRTVDIDAYTRKPPPRVEGKDG